MKSSLILLVSIALASITFAADAPADANAQAILAVPEQTDPKGQTNLKLNDQKKSDQEAAEESPSQAYVIDVSKKSTRGYDENGRQEVVNIGPRMKTTADGQTQSRSGPRGRQRGAVLPHKYIVRLKNGADFSSLDLHSKVAEHNRLARVPPLDENKQQPQQDGQERVEQEIIPNQVDHEYDFGTWKGYAGQFSSDFVKELEAHDEVEYVEEDTLMWAWGVDDLQQQGVQRPEAAEVDEEQDHDQQGEEVPEASEDASPLEPKGADDDNLSGFDATAVEYFSLRAPSWGLTRISERQRDLRKDYSYTSSAGDGVDVYIIDSGVFEEHRDFGGRAFNIANFVPGEEETDTCGHGTHVAGIVAGRRYGVAKSAAIQAIKVLDSEGQGSTSQVLAGIDYMIRHAINNPNPKKVINMSLGGQYSRPVNEAVRVAVTKHGLPFFVAAGNTGDDACQYSPASVEEAFAVGGSDRSDRVGWYSCVGSCVNIFAPGSGIASDWIRSSTAAHILDGTSMAAPHVAGVAALFLASGGNYSSAHDLYADIIHHSTQGVINGLPSGEWRTTRNLLYNKLEDNSESYAVKPQDGFEIAEERIASVPKLKTKDLQRKVHHHHH